MRNQPDYDAENANPNGFNLDSDNNPVPIKPKGNGLKNPSGNMDNPRSMNMFGG